VEKDNCRSQGSGTNGEEKTKQGHWHENLSSRLQITSEKLNINKTNTKPMKKMLWICSAVGLLTAITTQIPAQDEKEKSDAAKKGDESNLVVAKTNVVKATVEEIDHAKRELTLKDAKGDEHKMKVSEEVKNLDQVKKGDQVAIGFYQSIGLSVHKPGEAPPAAKADAVIVAEKGQKPGGLAVQTTQKTVTVEDIDYSTREVTLKGSDGKTMKITAGDKVKRLEDVKKGDRIVATYTEALAVSVKPEE